MAANRSTETETETETEGLDATQIADLDANRPALKQLLHNRLVECGWNEEVRALCREMLPNRQLNNNDLNEIFCKLKPKAHSLVPDAVREELMLKIREMLN